VDFIAKNQGFLVIEVKFSSACSIISRISLTPRYGIDAMKVEVVDVGDNLGKGGLTGVPGGP
jgi:hypothetical protein